MRNLSIVGLVVGLLGFASVAAGDDKDVAGTWKWSVERKGKGKGKATETTLRLKVEGEKVTGTVSVSFGGKDIESKIEDGKIKGGELSFTVTRAFNDKKFSTKYNGKFSGDTIKGTISSDFGGKENKRPWEAKRAKD